MINRLYGGPADGFEFPSCDHAHPPEALYVMLVNHEGAIRIASTVAHMPPQLARHFAVYQLTEYVVRDHANFTLCKQAAPRPFK